MNIIIIDDQKWREEYYNNLSTISGFKFNLTFLSEAEVNEGIIIDKADLILLDVVLTENWNIDSSFVAQQIREKNQNIPIVLVTAQWTAENYVAIQKISQQHDAHPVPLAFCALLTVEQANECEKIDKKEASGVKDSNLSYFARTLRMIVENKSKQVYLDKDKDSSLCILHLSDIQMGGVQVEGNLLEAIPIAQHTENHHQKPDFIVITGDIAENGRPDEFKLAEKWISKLCSEIGWTHPFDRVLLVPGNHDVFAPAFGICKTTYHKGNFTFDKKINNDSLASNFALKNFRDFAYRLTKNSYWMDRENSDWLDNRFSVNGISFLGINSVVNNTFEKPFEGLPIEEHYQQYYTNITISTDTLIIALAHHPNIVDDANYKIFSQANTSPNVLLAGHKHEQEFNANTIRALNQLTFIAPTLSLNAGRRPDDTNRGFAVIELKRKDRKVTEFMYCSYNKISDRWHLGESYHYIREWKGNCKCKWKEV